MGRNVTPVQIANRIVVLGIAQPAASGTAQDLSLLRASAARMARGPFDPCAAPPPAAVVLRRLSIAARFSATRAHRRNARAHIGHGRILSQVELSGRRVRYGKTRVRLYERAHRLVKRDRFHGSAESKRTRQPHKKDQQKIINKPVHRLAACYPTRRYNRNEPLPKTPPNDYLVSLFPRITQSHLIQINAHTTNNTLHYTNLNPSLSPPTGT